MKLLLALFLGLAASAQAVTLGQTTYSLHFDNLCVTENSGADASANADTWTPIGSVIYGSANPAPYEGSFYLTTTSASVNLNMSPTARTALQNATSWSIEFALFKYTNTAANQYVWSFDDPGLFLLQVGANSDVIRIRCNGVEVSSAGAVSLVGSWNHIFVEGNTTAPYQRVYVNGTIVTGTATAGAGDIGASTIGKIGAFHSGVGGIQGGIDQFRICIPACTPPGPTVDPTEAAASGNRSIKLKNMLRLKL